MFLPLSFAKVRLDKTYLDTIKSICIQKTLQEKPCLLSCGEHSKETTRHVCGFAGFLGEHAEWRGICCVSATPWLPHTVLGIRENLHRVCWITQQKWTWAQGGILCVFCGFLTTPCKLSVPHHHGGLGAHGSPSSVCLGFPQPETPTWFHPPQIGRLMWLAGSGG